MTESYLPVPVWNGVTARWEPVDFRHGQRIVSWSDGFDPALLPTPEYRDGDHVQFVRDETCTREGVVRRVLLGGGVYGSPQEREEAIKRWYLDAESMTYVVTARGHDHAIKAHNVLGRFVSLERLSRLFPLQE